jgi:hypothetical protein
MASRSVSPFVSRDLDPWLFDAVITHSTASLKKASRRYALDSTKLSSSEH